jgi:hypothetical protein
MKNQSGGRIRHIERLIRIIWILTNIKWVVGVPHIIREFSIRGYVLIRARCMSTVDCFPIAMAANARFGEEAPAEMRIWNVWVVGGFDRGRAGPRGRAGTEAHLDTVPSDVNEYQKYEIRRRTTTPLPPLRIASDSCLPNPSTCLVRMNSFTLSRSKKSVSAVGCMSAISKRKVVTASQRRRSVVSTHKG